MMMCTCEAADAQAVGGMQLAHQELAACLPHRADLQQAAGGQQDLHVVLRDEDLPGVGVLHQLLQRRRVHVMQSHFLLQLLHHVVVKHRVEVGAH